jgi:hypothetical protein
MAARKFPPPGYGSAVANVCTDPALQLPKEAAVAQFFVVNRIGQIMVITLLSASGEIPVMQR